MVSEPTHGSTQPQSDAQTTKQVDSLTHYPCRLLADSILIVLLAENRILRRTLVSMSAIADIDESGMDAVAITTGWLTRFIWWHLPLSPDITKRSSEVNTSFSDLSNFVRSHCSLEFGSIVPIECAHQMCPRGCYTMNKTLQNTYMVIRKTQGKHHNAHLTVLSE